MQHFVAPYVAPWIAILYKRASACSPESFGVAPSGRPRLRAEARSEGLAAPKYATRASSRATIRGYPRLSAPICGNGSSLSQHPRSTFCILRSAFEKSLLQLSLNWPIYLPSGEETDAICDCRGPMRRLGRLPFEPRRSWHRCLHQAPLHFTGHHFPSSRTWHLRRATDQTARSRLELHLPGLQRSSRDQPGIGRFHSGRGGCLRLIVKTLKR